MKASRFVLFVGYVLLVIWLGGRIYNSIIFDIGCTGRLKRAADANTIMLADKELEEALNYIENNAFISGYTSILYNTLDEDIGYWYNNLKSSHKELSLITDKTTALEKSNILMKLRETILDQGSNGVSVTKPDGIAIYPYNNFYCLLGVIALSFFIPSFVIVFDDYI